jgi:hypothetical protein
MKLAGKDLVTLGFDPSTKAILQNPLEVSAAIIFFGRTAAENDWGFFIGTGDLVFDKLAKGKRNDLTEYSAKISCRSELEYLDVAAYPIDSGVPAP